MKTTEINEFATLVYELTEIDTDAQVIESDIKSAMNVRNMNFKPLMEIEEDLRLFIDARFDGSVEDYFYDSINCMALTPNRVVLLMEDCVE